MLYLKLALYMRVEWTIKDVFFLIFSDHKLYFLIGGRAFNFRYMRTSTWKELSETLSLWVEFLRAEVERRKPLTNARTWSKRCLAFW